MEAAACDPASSLLLLLSAASSLPGEQKETLPACRNTTRGEQHGSFSSLHRRHFTSPSERTSSSPAGARHGCGLRTGDGGACYTSLPFAAYGQWQRWRLQRRGRWTWRDLSSFFLSAACLDSSLFPLRAPCLRLFAAVALARARPVVDVQTTACAARTVTLERSTRRDGRLLRVVAVPPAAGVSRSRRFLPPLLFLSAASRSDAEELPPIRVVASEVFGVSRGGKQEEAKDTWWWNDKVQRAIKEKKECFKRLHLDKSATNIEGYKIAKRAAKRAVSVAKGQTYDNLYQRLGTKEGEKDIYRMARIRERKTRDINQIKCIKDGVDRLLTLCEKNSGDRDRGSFEEDEEWSENLLVDVSEPVSALTLQGPDDSSSRELLYTKSFEESVAASPVVAHITIDGSSCTSPFTHEKLLASAAESSSVLALQGMEASSSEDDTTSSEESMTATPCTHNAIDGFPPSASFDMSKILIRNPPNWHQVYFIRMDRSGYFRMYPDLGGPFQSVDEAEAAINRHLELQHQAMLMEQDKLSNVERLMHEHYFYPDGTPKRGPEARKRRNMFFKEEHYLVEALVDQYNEDHHHFEDFAHELERIVKYAWMFENERWFYHFNFTTKTKAGSGILFFAEVSRMHQEDAWEVKCCCMISSDDKGCNEYFFTPMILVHSLVVIRLDICHMEVEAGEDRLRAIFEHKVGHHKSPCSRFTLHPGSHPRLTCASILSVQENLMRTRYVATEVASLRAIALCSESISVSHTECTTTFSKSELVGNIRKRQVFDCLNLSHDMV
ncbi:hypothetical protein PR202_gb17971 [Eleusine coracana subsp. coracana]|uniref:DUF3615 domain-containing protein n=1 Tax=Eleusine coracana subsp. coracana TaxID=191504 RepID=A0AAV5F420_ELECO|nr:hypothetical protein PR202_gb17971 [Eleusine coracana subsp. coracana]